MKHMSGSSTMNNNSKLTSPTFSFIKTANPLLFLHVQSMSIGGGQGERERIQLMPLAKKKNPSRVSIIFSCICVFLFVFAWIRVFSIMTVSLNILHLWLHSAPPLLLSSPTPCKHTESKNILPHPIHPAPELCRVDTLFFLWEGRGAGGTESCDRDVISTRELDQ